MFTDGLVTLFAFGGIFSAKVFFFSQKEILIFAIALNVTAGLGAVLSGKLTDRFGPSLVMRVSLLSLTGLGIIAIIATDSSVFWAASLILGLLLALPVGSKGLDGQTCASRAYSQYVRPVCLFRQNNELHRSSVLWLADRLYRL